MLRYCSSRTTSMRSATPRSMSSNVKTAMSGPWAAPETLMRKGLSSASLLARFTTAVRVPLAVGEKVTAKVVVAPGAALS